ncbi:MAG: hypothetical protein LWW86_05385 [Micrococcales bacterium]|nr:hypothetical protein [Micrococcales bacterium]
MSTQGVAGRERADAMAESPLDPARQALGLAGRILADTGLALLRAGVPLLALALTSFVLQSLLIDRAADLAAKNGPAGLAVLVASIALRLALLAAAILVAARAIRIDGEPLTRVGPRLGAGRAIDSPGAVSDALRLAIVPMVVLYSAWEQINWDIHRFMLRKYGNSFTEVMVTGSVTDRSNISFSDGGWRAYIPWAIACFVLKVVVEKVADRTEWRLLDAVIVVLECAWVVLGWLVISRWIFEGREWLGGRVVAERWRGLMDWLGGLHLPFDIHLPQVFASVWSGLTTALGVGYQQLLWPLVWVAVVGLLVGWASEREISLGREHRDYGVRVLARALDTSTAGLREKYAPLADTARVMLRAGLLPLLTIAVLYAALMHVFAWARWLLAELVHPEALVNTHMNDVFLAVTDSLAIPVRVAFLCACFAGVLRVQQQLEQRRA